MKFSVKGLALVSAILWGLAMLVMGLGNLIWSSYGQQFLPSDVVGLSRLPCHAQPCRCHRRDALTGAVDGLIGGAVFAWVYNRFAGTSV